MLAVHWVWDTSSEADEFYRIFGDYLSVLNSSGEVADYPIGTCWKSLGDEECIFRVESDTYWLKIPAGVSLLDILDLYSISVE